VKPWPEGDPGHTSWASKKGKSKGECLPSVSGTGKGRKPAANSMEGEDMTLGDTKSCRVKGRENENRREASCATLDDPLKREEENVQGMGGKSQEG